MRCAALSLLLAAACCARAGEVAAAPGDAAAGGKPPRNTASHRAEIWARYQARKRARHGEPAVQDAHGLPSVWECARCGRCVADAQWVATAVPPSQLDSVAFCEACAGCTHELSMLNLTSVLPGAKKSGVINMRPGNTGASITVAHGPDGAFAGVVKLHNVLSPMVSAAQSSYMKRRYLPGQLYDRHEHAMVAAIAAVSRDCGLAHITLAEWTAPLRAVVPGSGVRVDVASATWAERAEGVSLDALTTALPPAALVETLRGVPHAAVRDAALFDLLLVQGDRHGENAFISRKGRYFKLIDSRDAALSIHGLDSMFFPGTPTFQRSRIGNRRFTEGPQFPLDTNRLPLTMLDYRCHVPGGAIGFNYPPQFASCIKSIAAQDPEQLTARYGLPNDLMGRSYEGKVVGAAERLRHQAIYLRELGFEEALRRTRHKNTSGMVPSLSGFPEPPPCCLVEQNTDPARPSSDTFTCTADAATLFPPAGVPLPPAPRETFTYQGPDD